MLKRVSIALLLLILSAPYSGAMAQDSVVFTMGFEGRYTGGNTTYHISFDDSWANGGHGESELEFPIANFFTGISAAAYVLRDGHKAYSFNFRYLAALGGDAGTMKDSDWIENDLALCGTKCTSNTPGRDLYTESDDELVSGYLMDILYIQNFLFTEGLTAGLALGYRYYEVNHDVIGCNGTYWGVPVSCLNTKVLQYSAEHRMPYVGINLELLGSKSARANILLGYSGWVSIDDRDVHLYPDSDTATYNIDRISSCNCSGSAYMVALDGTVALTDMV